MHPASRAWLVRAGHHGERETLALEQSLVLVGWRELDDLSGIKTREGAVALRGGKAWRSCELRLGSDRHGQLVERDGQPPVLRLPIGQLVVSPANILDQGMADDDHPGVAVLLAAAHRPQPRLQPPMIGLNPVVGVPLGAMPSRWQQGPRARSGRSPLGR